MVQTRSFRFILSAGMIFGVAFLLGCIAPAQTKAPEPPGTMQGQVVDLPALLKAADKAFQDGSYEAARKLYAMAQPHADQLTPAQADTVRTRIARIDSILHERALAAKPAAPAAAPKAAAPVKPVEEKVVSPTESARVAKEQGPALLAQVETLLAAGNYTDCVPKLAVLDPLRKDMPPDLKLRYDEARFSVGKVANGMPALSDDQRADRAQEDFDIGRAAYDKNDLLLAQKYLLAAQAFDVSIGWWDNHKLNTTLAAISEKLADLDKSYEAGKKAYDAKDYATASTQLSKVADSKVSLGEPKDKDVQTMLADARKKVADEKAAAEAKLQAARQAEADKKAAAAKATAAKPAPAPAPAKVAAAPAPTMPAPAKPAVAPAPAKEQPAPAKPAAAAAPAAPAPAKVAVAPAPTMPAPAKEQPAPAKPAVAAAPASPVAAPAKPAEPTAAQKAAAQKLADQKAAEQKAADQKAADQKAAAQKLADQRTAEKKAADQKAADQKAADQKAATAKADAEKAAAKREADAEAAYDAGMKAYAAKDYLGAKKNLEFARDSGVSFGFLGLGNRKVRNRLAEVNDSLNRLQTAYKSGKASYVADEFESAQKDLTSVQKSGISLGKDTDADIARMLDGIDKRVSAQRAAKAEQAAVAARAAKEATAKADAAKAEQAKRLIEESNALIDAQNAVLAKVAAADKAMAAADFAAARKNLTDAQDILKQPKVSSLKPLAGVPGLITTKLATVDKALMEQKRVAEAQDQLAKMVTDADGLTKSDPLAAEQKAQEARQFAQAQKLTLSGQQTMVLAGVDLAVDEKYGVQRQLRRTEYGKLAGFAGAYADAGESAKAAQLCALLADGDPSLVDKAAKDKAAAAAADAKAKADQQQQKASDLAAAFDKARQALKDGGVDAGLKVRHDIILQAVAAKLNGDQAVIALDEADLAFMDKDVRQALADSAASLAGVSDKQLAAARDKVKAAQQTMAAAVPPLDTKDQSARLYDLAQKLHAAVLAGDATQVAAAKQQMADMSLTMEVQKALQALKQGNYDEAKKALDAAPVADASAAVKQSDYDPARAQVDGAVAAQQQLNTTEDALAAHDFAKAAQSIQQMQGAKLPALLDARLTALGAVLNSVRSAQGNLDSQSAFNDQRIGAVRTTLAQRQARQAAWTAYADALKALFGASAEDAAKALAAAADKPGLTPTEAQNTAELAAAFASAGTAAQTEAEQLLTGAEDLYASRDNIGAAQGVAIVKASKAYEGSADVKHRADDLEKKTQVREQEAQTLYAQAVVAYKAGNMQEVGRLMGELKAGYSKTKAYQEHQ